MEKTLMLGKIEGRRRRGQRDEMVGWHHGLDGHEFEQALGEGEGQGSLADTTEQLKKDNTPKKNKWNLKLKDTCSLEGNS